MKRLFALLPLLLLPSLAKAAAPTFGQVMWTNDLAKVLLSPERSTNRIQLGTNLVTFGGVSSSFPAMWREGTTLNFRLADNSAFAPITAGLIRSRTAGMILDTEDSGTPFAYSFLFRKKGDTGNTNSAIANDAELGNLQWQGWDGAAFTTGAGWLPKAEQAWVAATSLGAHMQLRLTASNTVGFVEHTRFTLPLFSNAMVTFNGVTASQPALKRFGRFIQVRSADDTGFADFYASNGIFVGPVVVDTSLQVTNGTAGNNPALRLWTGGGRWYTEFVNGEVAGSTNRISLSIGSNTLAQGQVIGYIHSLVNNGGVQNIVLTNGAGSPWLTSNTVIAPASTAFPGLRQGVVSGSESWNPTNVGFGSIGFGSNNTAGAYFSSVLGGGSNSIATNSAFSAIVGGELNQIGSTAGGHVFIGGGISNIVSLNASNSVIVGGRGGFLDIAAHSSFIGGGLSNRIQNIGGTIGGGLGNLTGGQAATVAGGQNNVSGNTVNSDFTFVGGGRGNQINPDYGTIGGGETNFVQNNATYGFIGGGHGNDVNADIANVPGGSKNIINITSPNSFILGGTSNNVSATTAAAGIIGNFGTNGTPGSVLISPRGTHGSNSLHVTGTASTNIGPLFVRSGWSTTYGRVGGWLTNDVTARTNHTGAGGFTNLATYIVPAHALSNTSDTIIFYLRGNFQFAQATTNDFRAIYGTTTIFDTGFKEASNCTWEAVVEVTRTGNSSQLIGSKVQWIMNGAAGSGNNGALSIWATNSVNAENNGITNIFAFQGASRTASTITNDLFKVEWQGYPNF